MSEDVTPYIGILSLYEWLVNLCHVNTISVEMEKFETKDENCLHKQRNY